MEKPIDQERIVTSEEREDLQRALGHHGLVDATLFDYDNPEHQDTLWQSGQWD